MKGKNPNERRFCAMRTTTNVRQTLITTFMQRKPDRNEKRKEISQRWRKEIEETAEMEVGVAEGVAAAAVGWGCAH